ncbi:MAG: sugar ABC transporter substrate-binding protein [Anaerolineae bacterium]|nr:sugar ABC transporter substrate-binding protein [Anaerolineae bacterium]
MVSRKLTRRGFLGSLGLGAVGVLAAACQPQAATPQVIEKEVTRVVQGTPAPGEPTAVPVKIRFQDESEFGPEGYKVFTDELIPQFEALNPGITVQFEPATGDWGQKTTAAMAAGTAPDVLLGSGQWMEAGQFLALENDVPADDLADFYEAQVMRLSLDGHLYMLPKYVSTTVLAYNKDLCDAAGVSYPDESWSWAEFLDAVGKLTIRDASGKASQWGHHVEPWFLAHWVWANEGEWMDTDYLGTKLLIDQPKALEALKFVWDLQYTHKFAVGPGEGEGISCWESFQAGVVGIMESHSWQVTDYLRRNSFNWDFTLLPKGPTGKRVGHIWADGYGVYKGTVDRTASIKFARFITSPEAERVTCTSVLGLQPSRKSVASAWDTLSKGAKAGKNVQAFSAMARIARMDPYFKNQAKVDEIFWPVWDAIWLTGSRPLEEGVRAVVKAVNEALASA